MGTLLSVIDVMADVLSFLTFLAAGAAWLQIRNLDNRYQGIIRIPQQLKDLREAAKELKNAAPNATSNPDAVLNSLSAAESKLGSLMGWVGGRFQPWSRQRDLRLEMVAVRKSLRARQKQYAPIDTDIAYAEYRKIMTVIDRVGDYVEDRKLER